MAKERDFYGIKLKDHRKLTLSEYLEHASEKGTLPLRGKKDPSERIYSEYAAYSGHTKKVRRLLSKLQSDVRVHRYIFNNSIIFEFVNLDRITLDWIRSAHRRCGHPPIFRLSEGVYYL